MAKLAPLCTFFISASWPFFVIMFLFLLATNQKLFRKKKIIYPMVAVVIIGLSAVTAAILWTHVFKRNPFEYARFALAGLIAAIGGLLFFYKKHNPQTTEAKIRFIVSVFVGYQIVFGLIYFIENAICGDPYFSHIVI
jgi:hypothetical protein